MLTVVLIIAALASRCLQLVTHYLPQVRRHFESRLHGKHVTMLKHLDHVLKASVVDKLAHEY